MTQPRRKGDDGDAGDRSQDPLVERLRPDPSQPPTPVLVLEGLLGNSDRAGFRRLYLTRQLDYYAEFRDEDVLDVVKIEPDQPPFVGEQASRVTLRRDATIEYTRVQTAPPLGEFDLDVRLAPPSWGPPVGPTIDTLWPWCERPTREVTVCLPRTCMDTCLTCRTRCDTCRPTCGNTCITCETRCDTCVTQCPTCERTCDTCPTKCETRCDTCGIACTIECPTRELTCDTCGIACTVGCPTREVTCDTCGIACTRVTCLPTRCDTCVATRCDPCITRGPGCEQTLAC